MEKTYLLAYYYQVHDALVECLSECVARWLVYFCSRNINFFFIFCQGPLYSCLIIDKTLPVSIQIHFVSKMNWLKSCWVISCPSLYFLSELLFNHCPYRNQNIAFYLFSFFYHHLIIFYVKNQDGINNHGHYFGNRRRICHQSVKSALRILNPISVVQRQLRLRGNIRRWLYLCRQPGCLHLV